MTGKLTISPEHDSLPSVQRRSRHAEDACGGLHGRKRSSKDFYPPLMAFIRDRLHIRMMTMETRAQMIEEENILDNYKELEENVFALMVWELMNGTKEVFDSSSVMRASAGHPADSRCQADCCSYLRTQQLVHNLDLHRSSGSGF